MPRVEVHWSLLPLVALIAAVGAVTHEVATVATDTNLGAVGWHALAFTGAYLCTVVAHELGHGLAMLALGMGWDRVRFAFKSSVDTNGERTPRRQVVLSAAGPVLEAAAGAVLVMVGAPWSPVQAAGVLAVGNAVLGLIVPWPASTDGAKLWRNVAALGRRREPHIDRA